VAYIPRAISDILKSRVKSSKCTLIVVARQAGKSTLVKLELMKGVSESLAGILFLLCCHLFGKRYP